MQSPNASHDNLLEINVASGLTKLFQQGSSLLSQIPKEEEEIATLLNTAGVRLTNCYY